MAKAKRQKLNLSLLLGDVDYFKIYNETYGHLGGDSCLQQVAQAIKQPVKQPTGLVARCGEEEFAILLSNTELKGALKLAEMIRNAVKNMNLPHKNSLVNDHVTISMGVSCKIPKKEEEYEELIIEADQALYKGKEQGRDCVCCFSDSS